MVNLNAMGIIFSNMHDSVIPELTGHRTMASVPFASRYRLIDFVLSGMTIAGVQNVGVIVKKNYQSLLDHLGSGREWDLARKRGGLTIFPPSGDSGYGYHGRIGALKGILPYIEDAKEKYVILADCDVVCDLDYAALVERHVASGAEVTIAYSKEKMTPALAKNNVSLSLAPSGRVRELMINDPQIGKRNLSMGIMVIAREQLVEIVRTGYAKGQLKFEQDILAKSLDTMKVYGYEYTGYRSRIADMASYFDANMQLLYLENLNRLFPEDRPVYTKVRDEAPVRYALDSKVKNCTVADGCIIEGEIENCILFRGVHIGKGAVVKNCVLMQNTQVAGGVRMDYVITDKDVRISEGQYLGGTKNFQVFVKKGSTV
ncbi:MAG TPA: glucose-1-phosphate adenylyltransferase subunit GlgD [Candidatus Pygmaiobacter gallistercoris]|nr:glucose-1-phosphate adenylyltransferase subunit GlgD [Candidatus Pygmaiobacter gallistercoris]